MLPSYVDYLKNNENNSLMARYYGIFKIENPYFSSVFVLLM